MNRPSRFLRTALPLAALLVAATARAELDAERIDSHIAALGSYPGVTCSVEGDVVTLVGNLEDRIEEQRLIREIEQLDGVGSVVSNINTD